jgi:hypothetical protein
VRARQQSLVDALGIARAQQRRVEERQQHAERTLRRQQRRQHQRRAQRGGQRRRALAVIERAPVDGEQVLRLQAEQVAAAGGVAAAQRVGPGAPCVQVVARVPDRGLARVPRLHQLVEPELADADQHAEAPLRAALGVGGEQGLVDQRFQDVEQPRRARVVPEVDHGLGRLQGEPAAEGSALGERGALGGVQRLPRRLQRAAQGGRLARDARRREQLEALGHAREQLRRRQGAQPRRAQLDGQRQPVELAHQRGHGAALLGVGLEVAPHQARALHEELEGLRGLRVAGRLRQRQRPEVEERLARHAQALPRGDQERDRRGVVEPAAHGGRRQVGDLLEVVEDHQRVAHARKRGTDGAGRAGGVTGSAQRNIERARHRGAQRDQVLGLGEVAEHRAPSGGALSLDQLTAQARLARAGRAEHGDQAALAEARVQRGQLVGATDEARRRHARRRRCPRRIPRRARRCARRVPLRAGRRARPGPRAARGRRSHRGGARRGPVAGGAHRVILEEVGDSMRPPAWRKPAPMAR